MDNSKYKRYSELDIIKSFAVVLMVVFHYFIYYLIGKPLLKEDNFILQLSAVVSHTILYFFLV